MNVGESLSHRGKKHSCCFRYISHLFCIISRWSQHFIYTEMYRFRVLSNETCIAFLNSRAIPVSIHSDRFSLGMERTKPPSGNHHCEWPLIEPLGENPSWTVLGCVLLACLRFSLTVLGNNLMHANTSKRMVPTSEPCCSCYCIWCKEQTTRTNPCLRKSNTVAF